MDQNSKENAPQANSDERIEKLLDRASEIGAPIPPFFLRWNNEEKIEKLNEIISNKEGEIASSASQDENIENSNELEAPFNPDDLPSQIIIGLANRGIRIEVVDALMNLAMYDEDENTLKVRRDADAEHVVGYVKSLGIVGEEAPESDLTDEEKDVDLKRSDSPDIDLSEIDTNNLKGKAAVDTISTEDGSKPTVDISDELKLPEEAKVSTPEETPVPPSPDQNVPAAYANVLGEQNAPSAPQDPENNEKNEVKDVVRELAGYGIEIYVSIQTDPKGVEILKTVLNSIKESGVQQGEVGFDAISRSVYADDIYVYGYGGKKLNIGRDVPGEIIEKFVKYYIAHKDEAEIKDLIAKNETFDLENYNNIVERASSPSSSQPEIQSVPVAAPAPAPAPAPAHVEQVDANQNKPPKYLSEKESTKLADLRVRIAKLEVQKKSEEEGGETLESLRAQYEHEKEQCVNSIVSAIQDRWMDEGKTTIDAENEKLFKKEVNDAVFQTLVVEEHDQYIKSIRENRKAGIFSRALEAARNVAGTKAVQWYVGQSRTKRWAINTAVMGTVVGVGALATSGSATIAGGLVALRTARSIAALAGGSLGSSAGNWAGMKATGMSKFKQENEKKLDQEQKNAKQEIKNNRSLSKDEIEKQIKKLDEEYEKKKKDIWGEWLKEKEAEIKNTPGSFAEKTKKLQEVRDLALSKQRKVAGSKLIGSLVGGIGASVTTGAFADAVGVKPSGAVQDRMPKSRFEQNNSSGKGGVVEGGGTKQNPAPESVTPKTNTGSVIKENYENETGEQESLIRNTAEIKPKALVNENYMDETGEHESMMRVTKAPEAVKSVFEKPEQADFVPEKGSTLWGGMGKVLENNERFAKLPPEAKHFIQSTYLNKAFNDPEHYGFEEDPDFKIRVDIGKKINFAKLFGDKDEFERLLTKAENLSDAQKLNIKANDEAIANWVKAHPGEKATPEKIDEILNSKNNHATLEDDLIPKDDVPESSPHMEPGFEDETPAPEVTESYPDGGDTTPNLEEIESIKKSAAAMRDSFEKMNREFESVKSQIDKSILESAAQKGGANPEIINSQIKAAGSLDVKAPQISGPRILEGLLKREAELAALFKETDDKLTKMIDEAIRNPGSVDDSKLEEMSKTLRNITNERSAVNREIFNLMNKRPKIESELDNFGNLAKGGAALTGATVVGKMFTDAQKNPEQLRKEIHEAKQRMQVLEGGRGRESSVNDAIGAPKEMRSYGGDSHMVEEELKNGLEGEVNDIYSEKSWLGNIKVPGIQSQKWGLMRKLSAQKVLEFREKNSQESGLPPQVAAELEDKTHQKMINRLLEFVEQTGGRIRPHKPETTVEEFLLELGKEIRKNFLIEQKNKKAA